MNPLFKKASSRDLSNPLNQQAYLLETHNASDLLHKEIDINCAEQELLKQRIQLMKNFANDLPDFDSEYSMLRAQIQMDQVELDEIKRREDALTEQLHTLEQRKQKNR